MKYECPKHGVKLPANSLERESSPRITLAVEFAIEIPVCLSVRLAHKVAIQIFPPSHAFLRTPNHRGAEQAPVSFPSESKLVLDAVFSICNRSVPCRVLSSQCKEA